MFEPPQNLLEAEKSLFKTIEEIEQENKRLHEEKANLLDIEAELHARINEAIDARKRENEGLRIEVEMLKRKCEEFTQFLNSQTK
jgi:hypothetical protein